MPFLTPDTAAGGRRGVEAAAAPRADQAARPGLGGQRLRHARRSSTCSTSSSWSSSSSARLLLISATTPGLGGLGDIGDWWTQPIVFQKVVVWTLLWEILGLGSRLDAADASASCRRSAAPSTGCGRARCACRRGRTRCRCTAGHPAHARRRRALRRASRTSASSCSFSTAASAARALRPAGSTRRRSPCCSASSALLGLRDKVPFLPPRPEVYGLFLLVFLFPLSNMIVGCAVRHLLHLVGRASSKLNRHFPYVISVMISNTPWNRSRKAKAQLYGDYPDDLRPSTQARLAAHLGHRVEFGLPLVLFLTSGGTIGTLALDRDDHLPRPHHLDVPAGGPARVEPVHDLRDPVPLRRTTATCRCRRSTTRC